MNHKMRRFKQQLSDAEVCEILSAGKNGVLSLVDSDGAPYGVPMSYAYDGNGHIYLHSAVAGHKIDCVNSEPRCSFCVVDRDCIVPEEFTTYFRSVIVTGRVRIVTDADEVHKGLLLLSDKYCPGIDPTEEIAKFLKVVCVLCIHIEQVTGKQAKELVAVRASDAK